MSYYPSFFPSRLTLHHRSQYRMTCTTDKSNTLLKFLIRPPRANSLAMLLEVATYLMYASRPKVQLLSQTMEAQPSSATFTDGKGYRYLIPQSILCLIFMSYSLAPVRLREVANSQTIPYLGRWSQAVHYGREWSTF